MSIARCESCARVWDTRGVLGSGEVLIPQASTSPPGYQVACYVRIARPTGVMIR